MNKTILLAFGALVATSASAQWTANGPGGVITSPGVGTVNGTPGPTLSSVANIASGGQFVTEVWVEFSGLTHTWIGDVEMRLISPSNTTMVFFSRPGRGTGSVFGFATDFSPNNAYSFRDGGVVGFSTTPTNPVPSGTYQAFTNPNLPTTPDAGLAPWVYTPQSFITTFTGEAADGDWTLEMTDYANGDDGALNGWTIHVDTTPVPEPGTFVAIGLGLAGLLVARRRK